MDEIKIGNTINWFVYELDEDNNYVQKPFMSIISQDMLVKFANDNKQLFFNFLKDGRWMK